MIDISALAGIKLAGSPAAKADPMDRAANDFETMFVTEMLKPMMETVEVDPMFGGGKGEEMFRSMLTDEYGKMIGRTGGIGLASHIKAALIAAQDGQNLPAPKGA
jgi:peptidoglycan hydrolase FlgJ